MLSEKEIVITRRSAPGKRLGHVLDVRPLERVRGHQRELQDLTHRDPDCGKTEVLIEALPYIQQYEQKTFVIKYGGAAHGGRGTEGDLRAGRHTP